MFFKADEDEEGKVRGHYYALGLRGRDDRIEKIRGYVNHDIKYEISWFPKIPHPVLFPKLYPQAVKTMTQYNESGISIDKAVIRFDVVNPDGTRTKAVLGWNLKMNKFAMLFTEIQSIRTELRFDLKVKKNPSTIL